MTQRTTKWLPYALGVGLIGPYAGCMPDFDQLSAQFGAGNGGSGATDASGGTEPVGDGGVAGVGGAGAVSGDGGMESLGGAGLGGEAGMAMDGGAAGAPMGGSGGAGTGATAGDAGGGGEDAGKGGTSAGGTAGTSAGAGATAGAGSGAGGSAGAPSCETGLVACPGSDVCTDLAVGTVTGNTVVNCGSCGVTCSVTGAASSACTGGICVPACLTGFADCNTTSVNDGCEIVLDSLYDCRTTCDAGVPCASDQVCNAGACGAPQGITTFTVPFTGTSQMQRYADRFLETPDLTNTLLFMRLYAPGATTGNLVLYPTDATGFTGGPGITVTLASLADGWVDVTVPIGGISGDFDPLTSWQITIEVLPGAGPWDVPTVIYVDRIWGSSLRVNDGFDTDKDPMIESTIYTVTGSELGWIETMPVQ